MSSNPSKQEVFRKAALFLTERCNLLCDYCYRKRNSRDINTNLARKSIDFLRRNSGERFTLTFFGGEPLINIPLLTESMEYATEKFASEGKKISFSINTNGTLLNENTIKLLAKHRVNLILSIDGKPQTHDYHRKTSCGGSSFELLNVPLLLNYPYLQARMTVSPHTISQMADNVDFIASLGFNTLGIALTRDSDEWTREKIKELKIQYDLLADWYIGQIRNGNQVRITDIDIFIARGNRTLKAGRPPCSAGAGSIAIGTDGLIYPCHRFAGYEEACIGDIRSGIDEEIRNSYRTYDPYKVKGCKGCSLISICYKCMWLSFVKKGNLEDKVYVACEESKIFISAAKRVKVLLEENNPHYTMRISRHGALPGGKN